ncbi:galactose mutarotase [Cyanobium sp. Morenito 9A2]|uniref:aldose epimerase family protein n=1 Tax=Cyanobium sp. Morenito 9A2 TaxID=2823718 RepID=UPI0020CF3416|nr:galactose mutarotase [Cyanobium sp. Morenito 9A2]MCP9849535.1 galactose mutarotase [Cyanobium sp. Morenito 9A2]
MALVQHADPYPHWVFTHPASGDQVRLVPERGGLVTGWSSGERERLYFDVARFADPARSVRGGIPVLFPICGGLPDHPLPQHGFARDRPWSLALLEDGEGVRLELREDPSTLALFPHPFRLSLEVRPKPSALEIRVRVENPGEQPLPFSFGLHPYFQVSSLAAARIEGLPEQVLNQLTLEQASSSDLLEDLPAGVDLLAAPTGSVRLVDTSRGEAISLETTAPLDLVVAWSDPPRPMVCLEPWTAPRGALISGDRLLRLAAGEARELVTCYRLTPA